MVRAYPCTSADAAGANAFVWISYQEKEEENEQTQVEETSKETSQEKEWLNFVHGITSDFSYVILTLFIFV